MGFSAKLFTTDNLKHIIHTYILFSDGYVSPIRERRFFEESDHAIKINLLI